ncbi:MAG TPA: transcriptional repressor, partial [Bryobacteraceae bacterium]|nr:transcriptional repressor [Bryobacteraceae bacterium]
VREKIPSISLATVYKNIRTFVEHGMIREVSLHHGSSRLETNQDHHFHAVCIRCRSIRDVPTNVVDYVHCQPGALAGFSLRHVSVEFQGLCEVCAAEAPHR